MDKSRLGRILAAIGVIIALALAGWGLWTVTRPAKAPAKATAGAPAKTATRKKATEGKRPTATYDELAAAVQDVSNKYRSESGYTPYQSGPYAGMSIYELLDMTDDMDGVDDDAMADEIKTADTMPDDTSPEDLAAEITKLRNAYDAWDKRLWKTACDRFEEQSITDGMKPVIQANPDCMGAAGDPPANQGTKESYQAMVDWYENAADLSARCSGGA